MLTRAWKSPFSTKSDFARAAANAVGMAASDGFISTKVAAGLYGSVWHLTPNGTKHLYALLDLNGDAE